ncbi:hypothetical protein [Saccharibacillus alkalitolerans]|uniref:Uncharacterized protein n=1 Tax=Saccharibacillus alkalitolerans TaxID=2705290 RepID=A0ABX0F993_9BACL|nr:hypothetical protein [Saccharibacillus alkalitolerans]NGZ76960.1 hypothetical protein [Saccharibacillus alkalitolerans]
MNIRWKEEAAPDPRFYDGISLGEYRLLSQRWEELLELTLRQLEGYVNDDELCFGEEGMFPVRARLSGRAYVGAVSYSRNAGPVGFGIAIEARLTEGAGDGEQDYLGLEVSWFARDADAEFECWGIDSSSI